MAHVTTEPSAPAATPEPQLFTISQADYKQLQQLKVTDTAAKAFSASSSGTNAFHASRNPSWIIDSGASSHMSGTRSLFTQLSQLSDVRSVAIADGRSCSVSGEGVVQASSHLSFDKVLFVSKFPVNLLSISAITKQLNYCVTFFPFHCTFQDLQTGRRIDLGREQGTGVYMLVWDDIPHGLASVASTSESSSLWHNRLGHPSHQKLQQALPWRPLSHFDCESCQLGKHRRASFRRVRLVSSKSVFDLVHCDIWGPSRVPSGFGFRYYIVFIDDFSRVSWVYLLKDRSRVYEVLKNFMVEIKNQFDITPKILRTDNALEFIQHQITSYCASLGILHQTSYPYTSQQNGIAERKHRHILDVTRTLMVYMYVPKSLWSAVLTATYLINRLPSTPLGGEVPFRRLKPEACLFPLPPRVFGCVAFV